VARADSGSSLTFLTGACELFPLLWLLLNNQGRQADPNAASDTKMILGPELNVEPSKRSADVPCQVHWCEDVSEKKKLRHQHHQQRN